MAPLENMSGTYCVKCPQLSRTPAIACSSTYIHVAQVVIHLTAETLHLSKCICTCTFTLSSIPGGCRFFTVPLNIHTYTCRHLPCINFKDSARPAELLRWLSWYSICLERRRSRVRVPPEAALLFLWKKRVVFGCRCLHLLCLYN